jgi:DNA-binding LacI/PurR family transcriptional regulator
MKPTIYTVAQQSGVSIATVSKVINNTGRISEKTRRKVLDEMKKLNYHPSTVASALTGKGTKIIGLLVPDVSNPFFSEITRSIEDYSNSLDYSVMICSTDNKEERERKYISLLLRQKSDGIILASNFQNDALVQELFKRDIPVVLLAQEIPTMSMNTVTIDDFNGSSVAMQHLLSLGHRKIGIIAEKNRSGIERVRAYKAMLEEYGITIDDSYIMRCDASISEGVHCGEQLLRHSSPPTAIFACNDLIALGVMKAARNVNVSIPDELSVIGFDNTILSTFTVPLLTTVSQPIREMGMKTVQLLVEEIGKQKSTKQRILYSPELVIRESTAPVKQ